jgi:hypothetical protein
MASGAASDTLSADSNTITMESASDTNGVRRSGNSASTSLWRPLRSPTFRNLLIANVVSDIGTFMQNVGAAWLMVSLNAGPVYVALTQTASALPFFVLALPAGAIGEMVDRRKLILYAEVWMVTVAAILATFTIGGFTSPLLLLILTFALAAGDAFESPTWRAVLPELVEKADLAAASALNRIEFNFARAVGPALAGRGSRTRRCRGCISDQHRFIRRRVICRSALETLRSQACNAARNGCRRNPRGYTLRPLFTGDSYPACTFRYGDGDEFFASGLLALLPSIARSISGSSVSYGLLLGAFGCGAALGALLLLRVRYRFRADVVISSGIALFGSSSIAAGVLREIWPLAPVMLVAGASWVSFSINVQCPAVE